MSPLEIMHEAWAEAAAVAGTDTRDYLLAGRPVRIRIAGPELARDTHEIFAHLRSHETVAEPALSIQYWDENTTAVPQPAAASAALKQLERSWEIYQGSFHVSGNGRILGQEMIDSLICMDRKAASAVACTRGARELTLSARGKPFHPFLNVWLADAGIHMTHAGCAAVAGEAALISGRSGSGKSTTSLACLLGGLDFLSDDCIGLAHEADDSFVAHSLFGSAFLDEAQSERFPELARHASRGSRDFQRRCFVAVSRSEHTRLVSQARVRVILLPRFAGGRKTRATRISPGEALLAMAPNSVLGMRPALGHVAFERLSQLVQQVPAYRLETGTDLPEIPHRVREILAEHGDSEPPGPVTSRA